MAIICYPNLTAPMYGNEKREPKNSAEICVDESLDLLKTNNQNEKTQAKQLNIENDSNKKNEQLSGNSESVQIEIDEESYDEAESVNEDNNLNNAIINSSDNICTKMYGFIPFSLFFKLIKYFFCLFKAMHTYF